MMDPRDLRRYALSRGRHLSPEAGRCAMEWVAFIAGEPHTDRPKCVCPTLTVFGIGLNDALDDAPRQRLRPLLGRCVGTAGDGLAERRSFMALDWLVRTYTPTWLAVAGLDGMAERLRALPEVVDVESARAAGIVARKARAAARVAAGVAARDAAWVAALDAAEYAAGAAAVDAALAVGDAALAAALAAAEHAARAAARDAARDALAPTVRELQDSALRLFERMLPTVMIDLPEPVMARAREVTA